MNFLTTPVPRHVTLSRPKKNERISKSKSKDQFRNRSEKTNMLRIPQRIRSRWSSV